MQMKDVLAEVELSAQLKRMGAGLTFAKFFQEHYVRTPGSNVKRGKMLEKFDIWCCKEGLHHWSKREFTEAAIAYGLRHLEASPSCWADVEAKRC